MRLASLLGLAVVWLAAPPLAAQQIGTRDSLRDTTAVRAQRLAPLEARGVHPGYRAPVTSAAMRAPTALKEVPQAVTILPRAFVADQAIASMAEAARWLPGVTFAQGEGNRDAPTMRGTASTSALFVDGMRDDVQYFRDLYATERLEAVKGPNALMFGRGSGGGILNRVTKVADFTPVREVVVQGGSYGSKRGTLDLGQSVAGPLAVRLNAVYENSDQFRRDVRLERFGVLPTVSLRASAATTVTASYERFSDDRTADRGLPSFGGLPLAADRRTFFGNAALSTSRADANIAVAGVQSQWGRVALRSRVQYAAYDKYYQNVFPGVVNAAGTQVALSAYNNATSRWNFLQQTDAVLPIRTGAVEHTVMAGLEFGRQVSRNLRLTGFFDNTATSVSAPLEDPTTAVPVTFRAGATDADNRSLVSTYAALLQDRIALHRAVQLVAGLRLERFDLTFNNNRASTTLARADNLVSPRLGVVVLPARDLSLYGSYSVAQLPSAGDQFSSLTATSATLEPEVFTNLELGAKADLTRNLAFSVAAYRLDRTNTSAPSPTDPAVLVQTGRQRSTGIEADLSGSIVRGWQIVAGYAHQSARITSRTSASVAGARVPIVPRDQASLWNRVDVRRGLGVGLGVIHQGSMFAAIDNTVTLPAWTRLDAALYLPVAWRLRAQVNVENVLDRRYFATAHSNNNISPGAPRLVRVMVATQF